MRKSERVRVNMRLPSDLVRWAKRHGKQKGKTFTDLVEAGLRSMQSESEWSSNEVAVVESMLKQEATDVRRPAIAR